MFTGSTVGVVPIKNKGEYIGKVDKIGSKLPANTLDQLIDELGGPECVSEMTGRKGRVVQDDKSGEVRYESRSVGFWRKVCLYF